MLETFDLSDKNNWTKANAEQIATELGFVLNQDFIDGLELFINNVVEPAAVTSFLKVVATGFFKGRKQEKTNQSLL